ncbi:hypothetical protein V3C99_002039 [Haemonchus contortus]
MITRERTACHRGKNVNVTKVIYERQRTITTMFMVVSMMLMVRNTSTAGSACPQDCNNAPVGAGRADARTISTMRAASAHAHQNVPQLVLLQLVRLAVQFLIALRTAQYEGNYAAVILNTPLPHFKHPAVPMLPRTEGPL